MVLVLVARDGQPLTLSRLPEAALITMLIGKPVVICDATVSVWQPSREFDRHGLRIARVARDGVEAAELTLKDRPDILFLSAAQEKLHGVEAVRQIVRH